MEAKLLIEVCAGPAHSATPILFGSHFCSEWLLLGPEWLLIILSLAAGFILNMATESVLRTIGPPYNS